MKFALGGSRPYHFWARKMLFMETVLEEGVKTATIKFDFVGSERTA